MAGLSPNNLMRKKNQLAARRIKSGSPKLQEILRQRCRQQMHERRHELFLKRRPGLTDFSQDEKQTLADIIHSEFENLASMECSDSDNSPSNSKNIYEKPSENIGLTFSLDDINFQIEEELEELWILEEYKKILWEQKQMSAMFENDDVICPICLKNPLYEDQNHAVCYCGFKIAVRMGLIHFKNCIMEQVNIHSATCLSAPKFSVFQEGEKMSLCLTCPSCDIFTII